MAYFSLNKLPKKERIQLIGEFYDAVSDIKNRDEAAKIFRDLLFGDEIGNLMRRIDVAVLILAGFSYREITELLGVGKSKVRLVQQKLERGGEGYKLLIQRFLEKRRKRMVRKFKDQKKRERRIEKPDFELLKKKYPGPFLLWNVIDELGDFLEAQKFSRKNKETIKKHYQIRRGKF